MGRNSGEEFRTFGGASARWDLVIPRGLSGAMPSEGFGHNRVGPEKFGISVRFSRDHALLWQARRCGTLFTPTSPGDFVVDGLQVRHLGL